MAEQHQTGGRLIRWIKAAAAWLQSRRGISSFVLRALLGLYWVAAVAIAVIGALFLVLTLREALITAPRWWSAGDVITALRAQISGSPTIFLAVIAGALSVPIVLYRARLQQHTVDVAARSEENTRTQLLQQRDAARREELTGLRLRGTEMLGAVKSSQLVELHEVWEETAPGDDEPVRLKKLVPVARTVAEPNYELRVAGIAILEEVAQAKDPFSGALENHWPVMETLFAYVRAVRKPLEFGQPFEAAHPEYAGRIDESGDLRGPDDGRGGRKPPSMRDLINFSKAKATWVRERNLGDDRPTTDIVAVAEFLRRRTIEQQAYENGGKTPTTAPTIDDKHTERNEDAGALDQSIVIEKLNSWCELAEAWQRNNPVHSMPHFDIARPSFHGVLLVKAPLRRLPIAFAQLVGADLSGADLSGSDLHSAKLTAAVFVQAHIGLTNFSWARMEGANCNFAIGPGALFSGARLEGAYFTRAELPNTNFEGARALGAFFPSANLTAANFRAAKLQNALFSGAMLDAADFTNAHLHGADLRRVSVQGACFASAHFVDRDLGAPSEAVVEELRAQAQEKGWRELDFGACFGDRAAAADLQLLGLEPPQHWTGEYKTRGDVERAWAAWREQQGLVPLRRHARKEATA
ncbi:MAG: pentapeptide repeat-containing protein [Neomegalonema sp.]|nr:pentapeptide repeat-containing protein [Neomegalonema sp.]